MKAKGIISVLLAFVLITALLPTQLSVLAADSGDSVSPQTGDSGPNALLIFLMFASVTAALLFIIGKRKRAFGK